MITSWPLTEAQMDAVIPRPNGPFIHRLALMDETAKIGPGVTVWAFASVHAGVRLGAGVGVGEHTYIGVDTIIGAGTRINQGVHITDHMRIGDRVFIGPGVVFVNDKHPIANNPDYVRSSPIVEDDVSIGGGAVILPGVRLGKGCVVGAGAVVTRDVAPGVTVVGNPARPLHTPIHGEDCRTWPVSLEVNYAE